jgi:Copper transport outer membrane protein, MctB
LIDFRYHLVSIVAVFLALAIGLVIGAESLSLKVADQLRREATSDQKRNDQLSAQNIVLRRQINADNAFGQASASYLLGHLLEGEKVVLVTAPGAGSATTSGVMAALRRSGAILTGQVSLTTQFLDTAVGTEQTLSSAARRLAPVGVTLPGSAAGGPVSGQQAAAQVLAAAIAAKAGQTTVTSAQSQDILNGFGDLGFLQITGPDGGTALAGQATLAVVVIPGNPPGNVNDTDNLALVSLTQDLQQAGQGALLAGSIAGSGPGSAIQAVTSGSAGVAVTTVDNADTEIGEIVVVQALSELAGRHAKPANYGVGPGVMPSPAPSSTPSPSPSASHSPSKKARR